MYKETPDLTFHGVHAVCWRMVGDTVHYNLGMMWDTYKLRTPRDPSTPTTNTNRHGTKPRLRKPRTPRVLRSDKRE